jgi:hypothetical protein
MSSNDDDDDDDDNNNNNNNNNEAKTCRWHDTRLWDWCKPKEERIETIT